MYIAGNPVLKLILNRRQPFRFLSVISSNVVAANPVFYSGLTLSKIILAASSTLLSPQLYAVASYSLTTWFRCTPCIAVIACVGIGC